MTNDLDAVAVFIAVVNAKGFRAAGERLGISGSAVSQTIRQLEKQVGVTLLQRTTRSIHLTEAGQQLYTSARPAFENVRATLASLTELSNEPRGTLRLHVATSANVLHTSPLLPKFLQTYPHVQLDVFTSDAPVDIVAEGYDAGIQLGEVIDQDMIAVPVSGDLRLAVVGAPAYFAQHQQPRHPRDLTEHQCINWYQAVGVTPYRWEFTEKQHAFSVAVYPRVLTNNPELMIHLARIGVGLTIAYEDQVHDEIERGELVRVLEEFCDPFPGFYLYYPQKQHASPALRAFVDYIRRVARKRLY